MESLTETVWEQCRLLPSAIKDAGVMQGKVAVVKLDPYSQFCFEYMYEVTLEAARRAPAADTRRAPDRDTHAHP